MACPAEDDETGDEPIDEHVDESVDEVGDEPAEEQVKLQKNEQPEQHLHAAEIMLRRVHANLGHSSKGLMQTLLLKCSLMQALFIAPNVI